ncbi:MAG: hypothetical protein J7K65_01020 [Planctomycetes bacterium]|nr:hypothetical protein [Planctomycetota bacterium]
MAKKKQADLIVMSVMFLSALLAIVSAVKPEMNDLFTGASIIFASSLIVRAMQWASEGKEE